MGNTVHVRVKAEPGAKLPQYQHPGDSGMDLHAYEEVILAPGGWGLVRTGLRFEIPVGYEIQVRSRSGLASKRGLFTLNSPGTIDSGYRGEVHVILANFSSIPATIKVGERIAQAVFSPVLKAELEVVDGLSDTSRGEGGFGSTGV